MIAAILLEASGFFMLSTGWYGWRMHSDWPPLVFSVCGVALMTIGLAVVLR